VTQVEWVTVGGPVAPWRELGLVVDDHGLVPLFGPGIRLVGGDERGIVGWALSGAATMVEGAVDGLPTEVVAPLAPRFAEHPLGAIGLDHVVVVTNDLERTSDAVTAATGAPRRRVREVGAMRQGFHRLGPLILELVEHADLPPGPASFWGLVIDVEDLEVAVEQLGPELISAAKPAVQPGRSIATVRPEAGLGLPVALMTPG
jgi:hypothetical protein